MVVTDYWQSLELLQAGLDRETADFYYKETPSGNMALEWRGEDIVFPLTAAEVPAWSMETLWVMIDGVYEYDTGMAPKEVIESMIDVIKKKKEYGL